MGIFFSYKNSEGDYIVHGDAPWSLVKQSLITKYGIHARSKDHSCQDTDHLYKYGVINELPYHRNIRISVISDQTVFIHHF